MELIKKEQKTGQGYYIVIDEYFKEIVRKNICNHPNRISRGEG